MKNNVYIICICLAACVLSGISLYRFYHPPVSGVSDAEARRYGFSSAERLAALLKSADWRAQPAAKLALLEKTFDEGRPRECIAGISSISQIQDRETSRKAIELLRKYPTFWNKGDQPAYAISVDTALYSLASSGNRDIVERLLQDGNPIFRSAASHALTEVASGARK